MFILFVSLITAVMYFMLRFRGGGNVQRLESNELYKTFIITVPMIMVMITTFFQVLLKTKGSKRSSIWLKCCNQLDINDNILTKIVPTEYLKYVKGENNEEYDIIRRLFL